MGTTYYLMPRGMYLKEDGDFGFIEAVANDLLWLITKVTCSRKQLEKHIDERKKVLNKGIEFSRDNVREAGGKTLYEITAIPFCEARQYVSFNKWPCNSDELFADRRSDGCKCDSYRGVLSSILQMIGTADHTEGQRTASSATIDRKLNAIREMIQEVMK